MFAWKEPRTFPFREYLGLRDSAASRLTVVTRLAGKGREIVPQPASLVTRLLPVGSLSVRLPLSEGRQNPLRDASAVRGRICKC